MTTLPGSNPAEALQTEPAAPTASNTDVEGLRALSEKATPGNASFEVEPFQIPESGDADLPGILRIDGTEVAYVHEKYGPNVTPRYEADGALLAAAWNYVRTHVLPRPAASNRGGEALGWLFHNPDTGTEWSENHPIESGECDDAMCIRPATATALKEELVATWGRAEEREAYLAREIQLARRPLVPAPAVGQVNATGASDDFGAHILTGRLGWIGSREIGAGHVVLAEGRYQWLLKAALAPAARPAPEGSAAEVIERVARQRDATIDTLHRLGVKIGLLDPDVACDGPQLIAAVETYCETEFTTPSAPEPDDGSALREALSTPFMTCHAGEVGGPFVKLRYETLVECQQAHSALVRLFSGGPVEPSRQLIEALEWYGEQARLCRLIHSEGDSGRHALAEDGGKRANAALSRSASPPVQPRAEGSGWQPIETAPKDPDCYSDLPGDASEGVGFAVDEDTEEARYLVWWKYIGNGVSETTHWMPLPTPPLPASGEVA